MTSVQSGGPTRFKGSLNEAGTVSVAGQSAPVATNNVFTGSADLAVGTNTVAIIGTDYSANARTNTYHVVVTLSAAKSLLYDPCGNLTNDGTRSYTWDAANRLTKITQSTNSVSFSYDGLGRRVQLVDVSGSATNSNKRFVWVETEIAEQRDSGGGTVQKQFFPQGVRDSSTNYFYTKDHLGSVREVVDNSQAIVARYDYDPYGRRTKASGSYDADFGYTGYCTLKPSWMSEEHLLPWFRIYRPDLGRFTSRDPLGENNAINLFAYVSNDPVGAIDPFGLLRLAVDPVSPNGMAYIWDTRLSSWGETSSVVKTSGTEHSCECEDGKYKLDISITARFKIYLNPNAWDAVGTYGHEQRHVQNGIDAVARAASQVVQFEGLYNSREECERAAQQALNEFWRVMNEHFVANENHYYYQPKSDRRYQPLSGGMPGVP